MPCAQCGGLRVCADSSEFEETGQFHEVYECTQCSATGIVRGRSEEDPRHWTRSGEVFDR
jgi:hypothetical protein